jgi:hypothetical protein
MLIPILSILTELIDIALVGALEKVDTKPMNPLTEILLSTPILFIVLVR